MEHHGYLATSARARPDDDGARGRLVAHPGEHLDTYRDELGDLFEAVTVPGGHTVYWDALDETVAALDAFLD